MNRIGAKRLLKLADFLDKLSPKRFYFGDYVRGDRGTSYCVSTKQLKKAECGTVACAIGWMPAAFPRQAKWVDTWGTVELEVLGERGWVSGPTAFFDIGSIREYDSLFIPLTSGLGTNATPKRVAANIRRHVAKQHPDLMEAKA